MDYCLAFAVGIVIIGETAEDLKKKLDNMSKLIRRMDYLQQDKEAENH